MKSMTITKINNTIVSLNTFSYNFRYVEMHLFGLFFTVFCSVSYTRAAPEEPEDIRSLLQYYGSGTLLSSIHYTLFEKVQFFSDLIK